MCGSLTVGVRQQSCKSSFSNDVISIGMQHVRVEGRVRMGGGLAAVQKGSFGLERKTNVSLSRPLSKWAEFFLSHCSIQFFPS